MTCDDERLRRLRLISPLIEGRNAIPVDESKHDAQQKPNTWRLPSSFSRRFSSRGQFMIVTIVLIGLAFFTMFLLVRTADRNAVVMFEQPEAAANFENLQNAIIHRNSWMQDYWWNLNWENRAAINITEGAENPVMVNAGIPGGTNCNGEVRVVNSTGAELKSNVNSEQSPCNVIFTADTTGIYYVYWNNPEAVAPSYRVEVQSEGNVPARYNILGEVSPKSKFCPNFENISLAAEAQLDCGIQSIINNKKVNYKIDYASTDFSFSGYLS
ncbi:MAG: hypothetical protein V1839_01205 [archaeon]